MIPDTNYPSKAASMADLIQRLHLAAPRLTAAVDGLSADEMTQVVVPQQKTVLQCVQHVAQAALGWTDMLYEAVEDACTTPRTGDRHWHTPLNDQCLGGLEAALWVYAQNNAVVAAFLGGLGQDAFDKPFKKVAWLSEPFRITDGVNWGLILHCDWHLAQVHLKRTILGKGLDWMAVYMERYPDATKDHERPQ